MRHQLNAMKIFIFLVSIFVIAILVFAGVIQLTQSQAILAQAETTRTLVIQHFFTNAAMFLLGGFIGASVTVLLVKRHNQPAPTQIHIPQNSHPRLHSPYVTRLDATTTTLVVEDSEQEAIEYESLSSWGW